MSPQKLHIISSDVPYPPDYGGMVDVFFKIKSLSEAGVKIFLHCFEYGRGRPSELEGLCEKMFYYSRKKKLSSLHFMRPYIITSRRDNALIDNLSKIDAPILFEGMHATYYLNHPALKQRFKILRNQNLEQTYYQFLAKREKWNIDKLYYLIESRLLKSAESKLQAVNCFMPIAEHEYDFFKSHYPEKINKWIPAFHTHNHVESLTGTGNYILYHGNLSHPENAEAAMFLLNEVCPHVNFPFIFAGKDPVGYLYKKLEKLENCTLIGNPDMEEMDQLIANAHIHTLLTFQPTGIKLKLLNALFRGRHVIVNEAMTAGSKLEAICPIANTAEEIINLIRQKIKISFSDEMKRAREEMLLLNYDNKKNAAQIIKILQQSS